MTDYATVLAADTVRFERDLPGPIERVWAYLTESDKREKWLARGPMDLREGGMVELTWENEKLSGQGDDPTPERFSHKKTHSMTGAILACEPPHLLSFKWGPDPSDSEVTFELSEKGDRVRLVLTHRRLSTAELRRGVSGGWHVHLGILEDELAGKPRRPFWRTFTRLRDHYEKT